MAGSEAMAASQASRIKNRKCCTTPTTQAAMSQTDTITRTLIVAAWMFRWSSEIRTLLGQVYPRPDHPEGRPSAVGPRPGVAAPIAVAIHAGS